MLWKLVRVGPEIEAAGHRANGITIIQQNAGTGVYGPHVTTGNQIYGNLANLGQSGLVPIIAQTRFIQTRFIMAVIHSTRTVIILQV
jgi:hypothetical protein